jgi:hypothetical protein
MPTGVSNFLKIEIQILCQNYFEFYQYWVSNLAMFRLRRKPWSLDVETTKKLAGFLSWNFVVFPQQINSCAEMSC